MPHRIALVGAELEENLSLRYLAASVAEDGFRLVDYGPDGLAVDTVMFEVGAA
jgi:hypothetical protein